MNYSVNTDELIPHFVFYDDKCSLCAAEINHYRKLETCYPIKWIGIHRDKKAIKEFGFNKQELLENLHVLRADGVVITGALAFATIWTSLKRYRLIGNIVFKLKLAPILNIFYKYFAKWRIQRRVCEI